MEKQHNAKQSVFLYISQWVSLTNHRRRWSRGLQTTSRRYRSELEANGTTECPDWQRLLFRHSGNRRSWGLNDGEIARWESRKSSHWQCNICGTATGVCAVPWLLRTVASAISSPLHCSRLRRQSVRRPLTTFFKTSLFDKQKPIEMYRGSCVLFPVILLCLTAAKLLL